VQIILGLSERTCATSTAKSQSWLINDAGHRPIRCSPSGLSNTDFPNLLLQSEEQITAMTPTSTEPSRSRIVVASLLVVIPPICVLCLQPPVSLAHAYNAFAACAVQLLPRCSGDGQASNTIC
jgi:hypothetical protein